MISWNLPSTAHGGGLNAIDTTVLSKCCWSAPRSSEEKEKYINDTRVFIGGNHTFMFGLWRKYSISCRCDFSMWCLLDQMVHFRVREYSVQVFNSQTGCNLCVYCLCVLAASLTLGFWRSYLSGCYLCAFWKFPCLAVEGVAPFCLFEMK